MTRIFMFTYLLSLGFPVGKVIVTMIPLHSLFLQGETPNTGGGVLQKWGNAKSKSLTKSACVTAQISNLPGCNLFHFQNLCYERMVAHLVH